MAQKIGSFQFTRQFRKEYKKLPEEIRKAFDEKFVLFLSNINHPSLSVKRIQGTANRWGGSVTMKYRFTFQFSNGDVIFRTIGTHDILNSARP